MIRRHALCSLLLVSLAFLLVGCAGDNRSFNSLQIAPGTASLAAGSTVQFTATAIYNQGVQVGFPKNVTGQVSWVSSNPAVATVSPSGVATAVASGATTISATLQVSGGPATATADLNVTGGGSVGGALTGITIIPASGTQIVYAIGETAQFVAIGTFSGGAATQDITNSVAWQSTDVSVATINASGLATAVGCAATNDPPPPCITNITASARLADGTNIVGTSNLGVSPNSGNTTLPSLSVYPVGQGAGTIVSSPVGISCGTGASCTADFVLGSTVQITATATSGVVLGFSSNCIPTAVIPPNATTASCTVTMSGNQTVGVIFNQ